MTRLIEARHIYKEYRNQQVVTKVLKNIDLTINQGDFCVIIGPSGSGKSTLLYVLSGLEKPTEGETLVYGKPLATLSEAELSALRRDDMGFVFQFYNLIPNLNVFDNVILPLVLAKKTDLTPAEQVLKMVGMYDFRDYFPNQLSGGMQQKVAIARAMVNDPDLIFADEPTGNLDQKSGKEIMETFAALNKEHGKTIVLVTHNPDHIAYATRKIELRDGMIIYDEPVAV